jgi:C_GCAxxG_C_C family probable redox protein
VVRAVSLPEGTEWISRVRDRAQQNMVRYHNCTQSILGAFMEEFGIDDPLVISAAGAMQGGMLTSLTCGVHTGGMMVLGLLMGREKLDQGIDAMFPIIGPAQKLIQRLNKRLGSHSCRELTGVDFTDLARAMEFYSSEEHEKCFNYVEEGAEEIALFLKELEEAGELFKPDL